MNRRDFGKNALQLIAAAPLASMIVSAPVRAETAPPQSPDAPGTDKSKEAPGKKPGADKGREDTTKSPGADRGQENNNKSPGLDKGKGADATDKNTAPVLKVKAEKTAMFQPDLADEKRRLAIAHISRYS